MFISNNGSVRVVVLLLLLVLGVGLTLYAFSSKDTIKQPIEFNHKKHIQENSMTCVDCHKYAEKDYLASIPNIEVCGLCHSEDTMPEDTTAKEKVSKVVDYVAKKEQIPWQRLYQLDDHIYFSHRRHTVFGKIACEKCHGDMGSQTAPPPAPLMALSMDDCINCHLDRKASVDCIECHK